MRTLLAAFALTGCFTNPSVEVDHASLELARGTYENVVVSIDGAPVSDLDEILWSVDDERMVTVTPSYDGYRLRVGGDREGETVVHIYSHGQDLAIGVRVGPPAILRLWTEPARIDARVGSEIQIKAKILDSVADVHDITFDARWQVRDDRIVSLGDEDGMMLNAMSEGETTLHVSLANKNNAVVPVAIFK